MVYLYSALSDNSIAGNLGRADYSYFFVLRYIERILDDAGVSSQRVTDAELSDVEPGAMVLAFAPPHKLPELPDLIPVFAWEYSTIPDEAFNRGGNDNWVEILSNCRDVVTHSKFAKSVIESALPGGGSVHSIPAPVWDNYRELREIRSEVAPAGFQALDLDCAVIDTRNYDISNLYLRPRGAVTLARNVSSPNTPGHSVRHYSAGVSAEGLTFIGFNDRESWGAWAKPGNPWLLLDHPWIGPCELSLTLKAHPTFENRWLTIEVGEARLSLCLGRDFERHVIKIPQGTRFNTIAFAGILERTTRTEDTDDPRDLSFAVSEISLAPFEPGQSESGVEYALAETESANLDGFHPPEPDGRWTSAESCSILLDQTIQGDVEVTLDVFHTLETSPRELTLQIDEAIAQFTLPAGMGRSSISITVPRPSNRIVLGDLPVAANDNPEDQRLLGIGIRSIHINSNPFQTPLPEEQGRSESATRQHENVLYTAILNPKDARKNWEDILTAFVYAFRDNASATLLIKMIYHSFDECLEDVFSLLCELHPFECQVVVINGFIEADAYQKIIENTHFIVNASRCEGQCLPLMEFMSSGVPAIATRNTAMLEYIDENNSFIVNSTPELTFWPHDPRQVFRTLWTRLDWESLRDAFIASYKVARNRTRYLKMGKAAVGALEAYCSDRVVSRELLRLVEQRNAG